MPGCDLYVTGASGFVGRHVVERARIEGLDVRTADGDLREPSVVDEQIAATRPRAVIHLAATRRTAEPWLALANDLAMAGAIVRAVARHAPDAPVLVTGSAAQYGMGASRPLVEDDATVPVSPYGANKCVIERAVTARPLSGAVRIIFTRSFNHIGPGQGPDAPAVQWAGQVVAAEAAGGGTMRTGNLGVLRDFLDVRDVAAAYLALVRHRTAVGVVNVCSGVAVTVGRVAELLVAHSRVPVSVEQDARLLRATDPPSVVGNPLRLRELTGWVPAVPLERSVAELLARCRAGVNNLDMPLFAQ
ncbi:MAG: GDP-4-dehydro-6-deoxy-D-mannose reductase [Nocardioidaceae bacterium]|jgi:GDP-4-dehydro-6-deoxy-D-mannose reductase|nr:GDP-4-dehydro-6-deoxy-D-mannose reductase [Nocardioidaceae bacterium]